MPVADLTDAGGTELPKLEPIQERVQVPQTEHPANVWVTEYGNLECEDASGLGLRELWAEMCRQVAFERIKEVPTWRRTSEGELIAGPARQQGSSPSERFWPDIWRYTPLGASLYVCRIPPDDTTKGGIIIPDSAKRSNHQGWVLHVSPDLHCEGTSLPAENPLDLVGRVAVWGEYAGRPLSETALDEKWDGEYLQLAAGELLSLKLPGYDGDEEDRNGNEEG